MNYFIRPPEILDSVPEEEECGNDVGIEESVEQVGDGVGDHVDLPPRRRHCKQFILIL